MRMRTAIFRLSRLRVSFLPLIACTLVASSNLFAQERDWQPQRTWVFVVGTLQWKHPDMFASFPQENRRDAQLVDFFRRQGVPAQQLVYLKDEQAATRRVKAAFTSLLSKPATAICFSFTTPVTATSPTMATRRSLQAMMPAMISAAGQPSRSFETSIDTSKDREPC